jgi:hypothetical protein
MNASRTTIVQANNLSQADESKLGFRTKTISTRLPPDELAEVEAAAERAGQPLSEWLRETALTSARQRHSDPTEIASRRGLGDPELAPEPLPCGYFGYGKRRKIAARIGPQNPGPGRREKARTGAEDARRFPQPTDQRGRRRAMNWKRILHSLAWLLAFVATAEAVTIWISWHSTWTPLECDYLPAYIWCSLPVVTPETVEVRLIWKTGRQRKPELATDDDADDSEDRTGMALSQSAKDAGWKTLMEGPPEQVSAERLRPALAILAFAGQSLWDFLLLPELTALAALCAALGAWFLVIGFFRALPTEIAWQRRFSDFQESSARFFEECAAQARGLYFRFAELRRSAQRRMALHAPAPPAIAVSTEPPRKPFSSFPIPFFGVNDGTGKGGYLWSEKDEIE